MRKHVQGFNNINFAHAKISKVDDLLNDFSGAGNLTSDVKDILDLDLDLPSETTTLFVINDEVSEVVGYSNIHLLSLLTTLWDYQGVYKAKLYKNQVVQIDNPCLSILTATTPEMLAMSIPPAMLQQGLLSRFILVHAEETLQKVAFPVSMSQKDQQDIRNYLYRVQDTYDGKLAELSSTAKKLLEKIYLAKERVDDIRFSGYNNRRFTQLLKLCLTTAALNFSTEITEEIIIYAYTILWHTEQLMPKALGEFGQARTSAAQHAILQFINTKITPLTLEDILANCKGVVTRADDLAPLLHSLILTGQIQSVSGSYLPKRQPIDYNQSQFVDPSYLSQQERDTRK
jgi:hypothetical protein